MAQSDSQRPGGAGSGRSTQRDGIPRRVPWSIGEGVGVVAIFFVSQVFFSQLSWLLVESGSPWPDLIGVGAAAVLTLGLVFTLLRDRAPRNVGVPALLSFRRPPLLQAVARGIPTIIVGVAAYYAATWAHLVVLQGLGISPENLPTQRTVQLLLESPSSAVTATLVAFAVLLAPVVEEIIFRGVLYLPIRSRLGSVPAALVVSLLFAGLHGYKWGLPQLFVVGLTLVAVFEVTRTLAAPIIVHALYNAANIALLLVRSGQL